MKHKHIADRINSRHKEDVPPFFWIALFILAMLIMSGNSEAADGKLLIDILECESSARHDVYGKQDHGMSYGIAQFRKDTFYEFAKQAGMKHMRYRNPVHQLRVMNWALDNGYGNRWTCFRKLTAMDSVTSKKELQ